MDRDRDSENLELALMVHKLWSTIEQSLLNKHGSREGILRYNESYFHYSGYIYEGDIIQLEDKFTLMNLPSHNTFPNKGLLLW